MLCIFLLQKILDMDGAAQPHEFIYIDEAGFNLSKTRRRARNIIGQRAIVYVPGQRGGNITMCAAIFLRGLLHHHAKLGPYNTRHILTFLDALHDAVVQDRSEQPRFVVVWDNVSFHRAALVRDWFTNPDQFAVVYLPPYSPFLNPIEYFFSTWRWCVYDRQTHARMPLLQAMEETLTLALHWGIVNPWMDSAHKALFSPLLSRRKYRLWRWWDPMARPKQTAGSVIPPKHN